MSVPASANLHTAISTRWTEKALDASFRAEWTTPTDTDHQPLNDTEARPNTPLPYCCFEVEQPVSLGHMTGAGVSHCRTERKRIRVGVLFTIVAKRNETTKESGKSIASRMLANVMDAFDPAAGPWPLPTGDDYFMRVQRVADWMIRHDQNTHEASVRYEVFLEQVFTRRPV